MSSRVLVIDNYDSFVFNLVQYLGELGAEPLVHRHDELTLEQIVELDPDGVLISPGPGNPDDARTAGDESAPAGEGTPEEQTAPDADAPAPGAEDQPAPRAPGRPPRQGR